MKDIERILQDAGERWRSAQPEPPAIASSSFVGSPRTLSFSVASAALAALAAVVIVAVASLHSSGPGMTGGAAPAPSAVPGEAAASPSEPGSTTPVCAVTKPVPAFVPPEDELRDPPPGHQWFGRAALYTALDPVGEVWRGLPESPSGFTQKTVWWSADWPPDEEPEPEIYVTGERLDAPGTFEFGPGTNATAPGIATAMMVGIDVPALGCWRITATYRDSSLSYTVLVIDE